MLPAPANRESQDPSLKRCYGVDKKVSECDWDYLSDLKPIRNPEDRLARLTDLLEFLNKPGCEHVWVVLDVKVSSRPWLFS